MAIPPEVRDAESEWKEKKPEALKARGALVPIVQETINNAQRAWRNREPPRRTFNFPKEFAGPRDSRASDSDKKRLFGELDRIAERTDTFIKERYTPNKLFFAEIWGDNAQHAYQLIHEWVKFCVPDKNASGAHKWARIISLTSEQRSEAERRIEKEAQKDQYKRVPDAEAPEFAAKGMFQWPQDFDEQIEHVLGRSFEALDPIRTSCRAFITWDSLTQAFTILGNDEERVRTAVSRLKLVFYQVTARKRATEKLIEVLPIRDNSAKIELIAEDLAQSEISEKAPVPKKFAKLVLPENSASRNKAPGRDLKRSEIQFCVHGCEVIIKRALETMEHYKGHIRMRARLGRFLLTTFRRKATLMSPQSFKDMVQNPKASGYVTESIGQNQVERGLNRVLEQNKSNFTPLGEPDVNADSQPATLTCTATVRVDDRCYQFEARYGIGFEGSYERKYQGWIRLDKEEAKRSKILDVVLLDLENDTAWNLEATTAHAVETNIPELLKEFADTIRLNKNAGNIISNERYFNFKNIPKVVIISVEQKTSWTYQFVNGPYLCEASRVQEFHPRSPGGLVLHKSDLMAKNPYGTLNVFHAEWDTLLAVNSSLAVGKAVTWTPELVSFFPNDDITMTHGGQPRGFAGFIERLKEVEALVYGDCHRSRTAPDHSMPVVEGRLIDVNVRSSN